MRLDRRALFGALGGMVAAGAGAAMAQTTPAAPPTLPPLADRITQRAMENRTRLAFDGTRFSGPAYDTLLNEARAAQFFCVGEEHGIAENPKLAAQLFGELRGAGYSKVTIEISPPMAHVLDDAARGGVDGVRQMFSDRGSDVAFFGMKEEAAWIAAARAAAPARERFLWGLDYEVGADRHMIAALKAKSKPAAAGVALDALDAASKASWARYDATHNPQFIFSFAGDPALAHAVRAAWPHADAEADWILSTLEATLEINKLWADNQGWQSNARRARNMRENFRRQWSGERVKPKVMFKFGANHMVRGASHTQTFEMGALLPELAESMGGHSFHVMVMPGLTSQHAAFDPSAWTYRPVSEGAYEDMGMGPLMNAAYPDAFTLIDLRAIRPLVFGAKHKALDPDLVRTVHGFDMLLVMSGSTPSSNL